MAKKTKLVAVPATHAPQVRDWEVFFRDQRAPVLRSQLITALMAGHALEVERLPTATLLDAVLLASTTRNYLDAEIIDDFPALLSRTDNAWKSPDWSCRVFSQMHMNAADFILQGRTRFAANEDQYIPDFVEQVLASDPPEYFSEELTKMPKKRAA